MLGRVAEALSPLRSRSPVFEVGDHEDVVARRRADGSVTDLPTACTDAAVQQAVVRERAQQDGFAVQRGARVGVDVVLPGADGGVARSPGWSRSS